MPIEQSVPKQQPCRLVYLKRHFVYGMTEDAQLVHTTFKSVEAQIEEEAKKYRKKQKPSSTEFFKNGLVQALYDSSRRLENQEEKWIAVKKAALWFLEWRAQHDEKYSIIQPLKLSTYDSKSVQSGSEQASTISLIPLIDRS